MTLRLCSICARGGSKGVKNKNLRTINNLPLIAHSINQARNTGLFQHIAVSSDSKDILSVAKQYGADILIERPAEMALDTSPKLPVIQHCAREAEKLTGKSFQTFVDLDATSPLRTPGDIAACIQIFERGDFTNLITGAKARRSPYFNLVEMNKNGYVELSKKANPPIIRRQDAPICFDLNASIYVWSRESLLKSISVLSEKTGIYEMPEERSLDIDSELDFQFVEFLMRASAKAQ